MESNISASHISVQEYVSNLLVKTGVFLNPDIITDSHHWFMQCKVLVKSQNCTENNDKLHICTGIYLRRTWWCLIVPNNIFNNLSWPCYFIYVLQDICVLQQQIKCCTGIPIFVAMTIASLTNVQTVLCCYCYWLSYILIYCQFTLYSFYEHNFLRWADVDILGSFWCLCLCGDFWWLCQGACIILDPALFTHGNKH